MLTTIIRCIYTTKKRWEKPSGFHRFPKEIFVEFDGFWDAQDIVISEHKIREANETLTGKFSKQSDSYINEIGILSLSGNNNNPTMWAHYASEHTGFVIAFDDNHTFFQDDIEYEYEEVEPGQYVSSPVAINQTSPFQIVYRNTWAEDYALDLNLLGSYWDFTDKKCNSWKYEDEWRLISYDVKSHNSYGIIGLVDCPVGAIKAVYLGLSASESLKNVVKSFCLKYPTIEVNQAYLGDRSYEILFAPVAF